MKSKTIKYLLAVFLTIVLVITGFFIFNKPEEISAAWWNDSWNYRKAIAINSSQVAGDLTDFPMLVSLTDANLGANAQEDGGDIIFINKEGQKLSHEIESFASTTGVLVAWVKMPTLSSTQNEEIYMYYGNAGVANQEDVENVWSEKYSAVWHMNSGASGGELDSTGNNNDLSVTGTVTATSTSKLGYARQITSNGNNYLSVADNETLDGMNKLTFQAWARDTNGDTSPRGLVSKRVSATSNVSYSAFLYTSRYMNFDNGNADGTSYDTRLDSSSYTITQNSWQMLHFIFDGPGDSKQIYFNAVKAKDVNTQTMTSIYDGAGPLYVGILNDAYGTPWIGQFDEVRIVRDVLTQEWITTEYNNQNSPATFLTAAAQEVGPGPVGYWSFDEGYGTTAHDESGQGNNGTINGATWADESQCISGKCLYFDGVDDVVNLTESFTLTTAQSVSFWIKGTDYSTIRIIMGDSGTSNFLSFESNEKIRIKDGTAVSSYWNVGNIENEWSNITVVKNGGSYRVYMNGIEVGSAIALSSIKIEMIGNGFNTNQYVFKGYIDEVKFYPYARSADQIKQDYAAGLAGVKSNSGVVASFGGGGDKWLSDGLVGYWKMDEATTAGGAIDSSGMGNNGTYGGNASTTGAKFGRGGVFDGVDDYVQVPNHASLTGDILTVAAWVNLGTTAISGEAYIYKADGNDVAVEYILRTEIFGDNFEFKVGGQDNSVKSIFSDSAVAANTWYHVVGVYDGQYLNLYLNGERAANPVFYGVTDLKSPAHPLTLGNSTSALNSDMSGKLDEVRIYNRALSPDEVRKLYEWAPGPVAHWKFDEKSGGAAYDSVASTTYGGGNNGTLMNMATSTNGGWTQGKYGSALSFDGVDDYVNVPYYNLGSSLTYSLWFKRLGTGNQELLSYMGTIVRVGDASIYYWPYSALGNKLGTWSQNNEWNHLVITQTGTNCGIYLNGINILSASNCVEVSNSTANHYIGRYSTNRWNGLIDDVKIYNYARTQKQILEDMNGGKAAGPVSHWSFDEGYGTTAHDGAGYAKNGTLSGASWNEASACLAGKCLSFDGTNDYVDMGASYDLVKTSSDFTLSAWVRPNEMVTGTAADYQYIFGQKTTYNASNGFMLGLATNGRLYLDVGSGASYDEDYSDENVYTSGEFQHILVTYDSGAGTDGIKYYINGALIGSDSSVSYSAASTNLYIGRIGAGNYFNGQIDEPKIWNYVLSASEIKKEYNSGIAGMKLKSGSATAMGGKSSSWMTNGLVGYWKMDEATTAGGAIDSSGNGNTGTYTGNASTTGAKFGRGGVFDGSGDYISMGALDYTTDDIKTKGLTYSAWFRMENTSATNYYGVVGAGLATGDSWYSAGGIRLLHGASYTYATFFMYDGAYKVADTPASADLQNNVWYHVVGVYDPVESKIKIYINNVLMDEESVTKSGISRGPSFSYIGKNLNATNNYYYKGKIDEVRIYNRALSQDEISKLYEWVPGPVLHMKLDEKSGATTYDTSGNGFSGSITGALWGRGKFGSALSFNGSSDFIDLGNNSELNLTENFTVSSWIKWDGDGLGEYHSIFSNGNVSDNYWTVIIDNNALTYREDSGSNLGSSVIEANRWYHISLVKNGNDSNNLLVYVNGVKDYTGSVGESFSSGSQFIGVRDEGGTKSSYFDGIIDDVKIYDYVRTPAQIAQDYNGGKPIAHYRFDECQGSTIHDESGNGYHGQLILGTAGVTATGTCASSSNSFWYNGRSGKYNSSGSFDGTNDYINIGDDTDYQFDGGNYDFSVSAWVRPHTTITADRPIVGRWSSAGGEQSWLLKIEGDDSSVKWVYHETSLFSIARSKPNSISNTRWYHLLGVKSGVKMYLYIDGQLAGYDDSYNGVIQDTSAYLQIASDNESNEFDGSIDEVKIWNYALTSDQVKNEYNGGAVRFGN